MARQGSSRSLSSVDGDVVLSIGSWLSVSFSLLVLMLKKHLTVKFHINLFRSTNRVKGLGCVVGAKFKPLFNREVSSGVRAWEERLKIFTVWQSFLWALCLVLLPHRLPLLIFFLGQLEGLGLKKTGQWLMWMGQDGGLSMTGKEKHLEYQDSRG